MPEAPATAVAAVGEVPAALVNTGMVVPIVVIDLRGESIVAAPALSDLSNYVSDYPNEEIHACDYQYYFRVVGSNSYYSLMILIYVLSLSSGTCAVNCLPVKNDIVS